MVRIDRDELVEEGLATVPEAIEFLKVSRTTLYRLMDSGKLPYVSLGRCRRIPKRALTALAAGYLHFDPDRLGYRF